MTVRDVGFGLPLAFAIMIEMVSAFGPLGILTYAEVTDTTRRDVSRHVASVRDMSGPAVAVDQDPAQLVAYIAERTEPAESAASVGIDELFADYRAWCAQRRAGSLRLEEFMRAFDVLRASPELQGKIKKFGARYFGIALAATKGTVGARA